MSAFDFHNCRQSGSQANGVNTCWFALLSEWNGREIPQPKCCDVHVTTSSTALANCTVFFVSVYLRVLPRCGVTCSPCCN